MKTGSVLPKRSPKWFGWKPDIPDIRDLPYTAKLAELLKLKADLPLPPSDALSGAMLPLIRNQGAQGSCTGHGTRTALQYLVNKEGQRRHELSPRFLYWNGRVIEGTTGEDSGCYIRDVIKGATKLGVAPERDCRYSPSNYTKPPSATAFKNALRDVAVEYARLPDQSANTIKSVLAREALPIVFGFAVYENFYDAESTGVFGMPAGEMLGGHCVCAVGYDDNVRFGGRMGAVLCANSWDDDWGCAGPTGERGYFWILYDYIANNDLADDFWVVRKIT